MQTRYFALVYGIIFLLVGIAGFVPALVTGPEGPAPGVAEVPEAPEAPGAAPEAPDAVPQAPEAAPEAPDAAPAAPEAAPAAPETTDGGDMADEAMEHGRLFGLFPVNAVHNIVHLAFGVWGVVAYRAFSSARLYARAVAVIYAILAVMGLIPALNTLFGLVPLYGHDIWLHAVLAVIAAYFGWVARSEPDAGATTTSTTTSR